MGVLQTSLRTVDGARRFNVPHTTNLWLRHDPQEIRTIWNHPRIRLPPRTTPSMTWHIRLKHLWDQWRPSTGTVVGKPGRHNGRISTQTMRNHRLTPRAQRPY